MQANKLLTIIVPTYNMQDYLHKCLNSLIVSSDMLEKLEVLVVNDGSTDGSSQIAHGFEERLPHTFRVIDKENGHYGSCVNRGLAEARGMYIKILDADDWFDTSSFEIYMKKVENYNVDMIISDYQVVRIGGSTENYTNELKADFVFPFQDLRNLHFYQHYTLAYRTQFLREMAYHQTEGIHYSDTEWVLCPQFLVRDTVYINENYYRYRVGCENQSMNPKIYLNNWWQRIVLWKNLYKFTCGIPEKAKTGYGYKNFEAYIENLTRGIYKDALVNMAPSAFDSERLKEFDNYLFKMRHDIYCDVAYSLVTKGVPFHYVAFWRKFGRRFPVYQIKKIFRK